MQDMNPPLGLHLILEIIFIVFFILFLFGGFAWQGNPNWQSRNGFIVALLIGILGFIVFTSPHP